MSTLRVATFNLENLGSPHGKGPPVETRFGVLRPQLERLDADIVCFQEVNSEKAPGAEERTLAALDRLIAGTGYAGFHRASTVDGTTGRLGDKHNLVVLSRWPLRASRQYWHDFVPPPRYRPVTAAPAAREPVALHWDRPLLHCTLAPPKGPPLHVFNLHLRAPLAAPVAGQKTGLFRWNSAPGWAEGFCMAMLKRAGQALEARIAIDKVFDAEPGALILVCGDFNAEPREGPTRIIAASVEDTGNGALAERALAWPERTLPESQRFSVIHHGERLMLDHILMSHALLARYRHFEVHNELLADELFGFANIAENPESYHAPVVAEFHD